MATILLQAAGVALGGVFGPIGAVVGRAAGALIGSTLDQSLINSGKTVSRGQLSTARIPGADEGTTITRVYGTARVGGTLFWATRFEEQVTVERSGGKAATGPRVETYSYYANFALGLCEGPIAAVRRVWADGQELDLSGIEMRVYRGTEDQSTDPLIEAKQGTGNTPAYCGLAYVVFERLPLDMFGNRIPVMQFEVVRAVGSLETSIRAINLIPGATEHGYNPAPVTEALGVGESRIINRNVTYAASDWEASIDELQALCPNLEAVTLIVSWFGTDLRASECLLVPGVEVSSRADESSPWSVSGIARENAHVVSQKDGGPAYGGTPSDASVVAAIADLKARGLKVFLHPFVLMDVPEGNGFTDPYGGAEQPPYPWRGRMTCHPAAGQVGTVDRTAAARTQVETFAGTAVAADFGVSGSDVSFTGSESSFRRMMLHYALLATAAGGVDGFVIGSELRGLTRVRDESDAFPFIEALTQLASDAKAILGSGTAVTYAADWSEYFGYHPNDGTGDVFFNLDPLWASAGIDAVGIDNYMPLADWRDDDLTAANPDGMRSADDVGAMTAAITAGEGFDWYYASEADRRSRARTAITDGLASKPWVFRYKDIESWWSNPHYDRVGGAELESPTAWVPGAKPIWFMELGCPAVERGANQPNVFIDPKSSESAYPHFSGGARSDSQQRRFLEAHYAWWTSGDAPSGVVDPDRIFLWTWDTRPAPAFPEDTVLFADGANWQTGHWLNGRLGAGTQADIMAAILTDNGFSDFDVSAVSGDLTGYVQGDVTSARELLEPILQAFQIGCVERAGVLTFFSRAKRSAPAIEIDVLADIPDEPLWQEKRGQESDLAGQAILDHFDHAAGYERGVARSRKVSAASDRILRASISGVLAETSAASAAEELLRDHRIQRRTLNFRLSPTDVALEPGDMVSLPELDGTFLAARIEDGEDRGVEAGEYVPPTARKTFTATNRRGVETQAASDFAPVLHLMDLPKLGSGEVGSFARGALFVKPWRTSTLLSSSTDEGYATRTVFEKPATAGTLVAPLAAGVSSRFDHSQSLQVKLSFGSFVSAEETQVLAGANRLAIRSDNDAWEVLSFLTAVEAGDGEWTLAGLLRGQFGTEDAIAAGASAGNIVVLLNDAVKSLELDEDEVGLDLNWLVEAGAKRSGVTNFAGGSRAATPLAPVHLDAQRQASGDIVLSWVRRGREDANNWTGIDIPLDEPQERYLLDIMFGETALRSIEVGEPSFTYSGIDELADFGSTQGELTVRVRQLGWTVAQGFAATKTITL